MSVTDSTDSRFGRPVSVLWGCELSSSKSSCTFQVPEMLLCEQQLMLRTVCLGENARDEFHVVEVVAEDGDSRAPMPLATLKPSVLPMATVGVELTPPVTFRLRAGSGPVYLCGQHLYVTDLSSEEEEEEEEEEETPKKPPKSSRARRSGAAKKRKLEKEDELNSLAPADPLPAKGRGAGRGRKAAPKK